MLFDEGEVFPSLFLFVNIPASGGHQEPAYVFPDAFERAFGHCGRRFPLTIDGCQPRAIAEGVVPDEVECRGEMHLFQHVAAEKGVWGEDLASFLDLQDREIHGHVVDLRGRFVQFLRDHAHFLVGKGAEKLAEIPERGGGAAAGERQGKPGEPVAAGEDPFADVGGAGGKERGGGEAAATGEGRLADPDERGGQDDFPQGGAVGEGIVADGLQLFGQLDGGQVGAVGKTMLADVEERQGEPDFLHVVGITKGLETDVGDAFLHADDAYGREEGLPRQFPCSEKVVGGSGAEDAQSAVAGREGPLCMFAARPGQVVFVFVALGLCQCLSCCE